jgi:hypothetical protein
MRGTGTVWPRLLGAVVVAVGLAVAVPALSQASAGTFTTVTLTSSENPSAFGEQVVLNATVIPATGTTTPDGTVTFIDGGTDLGTVTLDGSGQAALAESSLTAGTHTLVADYSGSASFQSSDSTLLSQLVITQSSMAFLISTVNPATYGQAVVFVVTVIAESGTATPTGSVTLLDGTDAIGTTGLASGAGVIADSAFGGGSHSITAEYSGDANFAASTSPPLIETVDQAATAVQLTSSANPSTLGQAVTLTATITPASGSAETGTVSFTDSGQSLGTASIDSAGVATMATSALAVGDHTITATYSGDADFAGSTSATLVETVTPVATAIALTSSADPSVVGTNVTLTATVTGAGATPTGTVTFLDGTTALGTASLDVSGAATLTLSSLGVGDHSLGAGYNGDSLNAPSQAPTLTETITQAASQVSLTSSANPVDYPASVTLTATVTTNHSGPGGSVAFLDGTTTLGTAGLDANGEASLTLTGLGVGDHDLTAAYSGDAQTLSSGSATLVETVQPAVTAVSLTSSENPAPVGVAITLTATVTGAGATPTGTVTFLDGTTTLGTAALDSSGQAGLTLSSLGVGDHELTATYSGDVQSGGSTSAALVETVTPAATAVSLASSENPAPLGASVTLTATVTGAGSTPTGTVTFLDGTTTLGTASLDGAGHARLTLSSLSAGTHSLGASYGGDPLNAGSQAPTLTETISETATPAATTTSLTSSENPSPAGASITLTARVTAHAGGRPTGRVTFMDGSAKLATEPLSGGSVAISVRSLGSGTHVLTAVYSGDATHSGSTSPALKESVTGAISRTLLAVFPNPARVGQSLTLTATVTASAGQPSGMVTFSDGAHALGTARLRDGRAVLTTAFARAGQHDLRAAYAGGGSVSASTSAVVILQVCDLRDCGHPDGGWNGWCCWPSPIRTPDR